MITLTDTDRIEVTLKSGPNTEFEWQATYWDDEDNHLNGSGTTSGTGDVTIVPSPSAGVKRVVRELHIHNPDSNYPNKYGVQVKFYDGSNERVLIDHELRSGFTLVFDNHIWSVVPDVFTVDDLDGDQLPVDWEPSVYSPDASPSEVADVDDLGAHLKGIDSYIEDTGIDWRTIDGDQIADKGKGYLVDASSNNVTLTLPGSPTEGDIVGFVDYTKSATTNTIEIAGNGENIEGLNENLEVDTNGAGITLAYTDPSVGWKIVNEISYGDIDGDHVHISWDPTNFSSDPSINEADDEDDLSALLEGIDDKFKGIDNEITKVENDKLDKLSSSTDAYLSEIPSLPKYDDVNNWGNDRIVRNMKDIFVQNPAIDVSYQSGPVHNEGGTAFIGSALAPTGEIILSPKDSSNIGIYDPVSQTYTSGPSHGEGSSAFNGAILAPTGEVILVPGDSDNVGIYDPISGTYTSGPVHGEGADAFQGASLAPTGEIIFAPLGSSNVGIYDPVNQTYSSGPAHGENTKPFRGSALASTGEIIFAPLKSDNIGIYDPVNQTYTSGPAHGEGDNVFVGASLAQTGEVIFAPTASDNIGIYDPVNQTYTSGPAHNEGSAPFQGASLAPTGEIILAPLNSSNIGIYDPLSQTYTSGPSHGEGSGAFVGASLAPTGEVILVPNDSDNVGIYDPRCSLERRLELNALVN